MKNLNKIIDKIEKNIDDKDRTREKALRYSREIILDCRKAIQYIHQNLLKNADQHIKNASAKLRNLYNLTLDHNDLYNAGFVENAAQEVVEAQCLYNIMQKKDLPDPDKMHTTYSSYLKGLCDVVGELRRKSLDSILNGETEKANDYLKIMEDIYASILRFDYPSGLIPIKRNQDIVRGLIEKTRGELAVASCERRIEYRTNEFRGVLDKINVKKNKRKIKKKDSELNIDRVWKN
jgi:translin